MTRRLLCTFVTLLLAAPVFAQAPSTRGSLSATGSVSLEVAGLGSASIEISGTFSGTVTFEVLADPGGTAVAVDCATPAAPGAPVNSTTTTGTWICPVAGLRILQARVSSYASGTVHIYLSAAPVTPGGAVGLADTYDAVFTREDHPNRIRCTVTVSTATTITAVGGSCAAPGAGLSIYVTDILFASSASGIAADAFATLKYGTGGTCGTGTAVFWGALSAAANITVQQLKTPIKIPANNELCWINSTAGSKFIVISGFIAP